MKDVIIHRKIVDENEVIYVVDFRKRKNIPEVITEQALRNRETIHGFKHFWLNEAIVPLGLVKAYESKMVGQTDKFNGKVRYYKDPDTQVFVYEEVPNDYHKRR